ncbi:hypothetical protein ES703_90424 [subsurface metagenome]
MLKANVSKIDAITKDVLDRKNNVPFKRIFESWLLRLSRKNKNPVINTLINMIRRKTVIKVPVCGSIGFSNWPINVIFVNSK